MHADRIVRIWGQRVIWVAHRDDRVAAARRGEPAVLFGHVDAVDARNARAALHTEQLHIRGVKLADEHSRVTQRATNVSSSVGLHALRLAPLAAVATHEGSYLAANSNGRKFLYNSKGLDVISLLVKYYVPLAHFNKVIKLLKFKSAVNLQCF